MPLLGLFAYAGMLGVFPFILLLPLLYPFVAVANILHWLGEQGR